MQHSRDPGMQREVEGVGEGVSERGSERVTERGRERESVFNLAAAATVTGPGGRGGGRLTRSAKLCNEVFLRTSGSNGNSRFHDASNDNCKHHNSRNQIFANEIS